MPRTRSASVPGVRIVTSQRHPFRWISSGSSTASASRVAATVVAPATMRRTSAGTVGSLEASRAMVGAGIARTIPMPRST
jgi:hypothetical protein